MNMESRTITHGSLDLVTKETMKSKSLTNIALKVGF